ncbi:MAG: rhomboid family intramembrane serine protease [Deltaproteobacteria bacterium]|nr:rhomboid family intramembrane serine protease [Deltaproteobacteria bacterium]
MQRASFAGWPLTPAVKAILIANAAVWLVEIVTVRWFGVATLVEHLAVTPALVWPGLELWQPFTYMWLHSPSDFSHILFNMLFLWMFGGTLEQSWGTRAFVRFYVICGAGAGLVVFLTGLAFAPGTPVLGASGAIYGLVVAWAVAFPNRIIYFFGIFPMKGKHFVLIPIGYAVVDFLMAASGVSHAAHLGGMAVGALLVTGFWRPRKLASRLRYWWLRRKLKVLEGARRDEPPGGWVH